jgi:predicted permease
MDLLLSDLTPPALAGRRMQLRVMSADKGFYRWGSSLRDEYERPLLALTVLVSLVLLMTCANIGTLLMVRNTGRMRDLTMRVALGAHRLRLINELFLESAVLAAMGGILAVFVAEWAVSAILAMLPSAPASLQFRMDWRTLSFAAGLSFVSTLLFGLLPVWRATQFDLTSVLKAVPAGTGTRNSWQLGSVLLTVQVAISIILLVGAGLFLQTLRNLAITDPGFDSRTLLQVVLDTRGAGYGPTQVGNLYTLLERNLTAIPGVQSVSGIRNSLMKGPTTLGNYAYFDVGPNFFETMRIPLVRGRLFTAEDQARLLTLPNGVRPGVVVISESFANRLFFGSDAVGRLLPEQGNAAPEIIGVVKDVKLEGLRGGSKPQLYYPFLLNSLDRFDALEIRTMGDPSGVAQLVRDEVRRVNPRLFVEVSTMQEEMNQSISRERMIAAVSALFGTLSVVLVCVGLFGIASYAVACRTNELGIRIALGARSWDVIRTSLQRPMQAVVAGLLFGVIGSFVWARLMSGMISDLLFDITVTDSLNIARAGLLIIAVAITACAIPARRAVKVDPLVAIRYD